jgi:acyl carrier protein
MIEQEIKQALSKQFQRSVEEITDRTHLTNDLNADSLDLMEIVMWVEDHFRISLLEAEYEKALTVGAIRDLVDSKLAEQKNAG